MPVGSHDEAAMGSHDRAMLAVMQSDRERWGSGSDGSLSVGNGVTVGVAGGMHYTDVTVDVGGVLEGDSGFFATIYCQGLFNAAGTVRAGEDAAHAGGAAKVGAGQGNDGAANYYASSQLWRPVSFLQAGGGGGGGAGVGFEGGRFGYFWRCRHISGLRQNYEYDVRSAAAGSQPPATTRPAWFANLDYEERFLHVGRAGTGAGGGGAAGATETGGKGGDGGLGRWTLHIRARFITVSGTIHADGGDGENGEDGASTGAGQAGGGGGGGGGCGGAVYILCESIDTPANVTAAGGTAGTGGTGVNGGGNGAAGRPGVDGIVAIKEIAA